jgi:hypothetical protein
LAHSDANVSGSIILASIVLKLALYGFLRILIGIFLLGTAKLIPYFLGLCSMSLLFSSFTTIRQFDLKVLVAYSSIAVRRKAFISYEFNKILPVSSAGTDSQLKFQGKPEVEHSMLIKRVIGDVTASPIGNSVMFSMIRPILAKVQYLFASSGGLQLSCVKLCINRINHLCDMVYSTTVNRSWTTSPIKDMSEQSKENKINKGTPGMPKACKGYGNRDFEVLKLSITDYLRMNSIGKFMRLCNNNPLFSTYYRSHKSNWLIDQRIIGRKSVCVND